MKNFALSFIPAEIDKLFCGFIFLLLICLILVRLKIAYENQPHETQDDAEPEIKPFLGNELCSISDQEQARNIEVLSLFKPGTKQELIIKHMIDYGTITAIEAEALYEVSHLRKAIYNIKNIIQTHTAFTINSTIGEDGKTRFYKITPYEQQ